jgi:hypothetical protein
MADKVGDKKLEELRQYLEIDADDLDRCLIEHSGVCYQVAEAYTEAAAERDALKLELEEETATQDEKLRKTAAAAEQKITETALQQSLKRLPVLQELERDLLNSKQRADKWQALNNSFQQRSYMLRALVDWKIAQIRSLNADHGVAAAGRELTSAKADINLKRAQEVRRTRRN